MLTLGTSAALGAIYHLLPLDHTSTWIAATVLVIGLVAFIALVSFQIRWIIRSRFPGLRAVEALATSVPLFLLLFPAPTSSWLRFLPATSARG